MGEEQRGAAEHFVFARSKSSTWGAIPRTSFTTLSHGRATLLLRITNLPLAYHNPGDPSDDGDGDGDIKEERSVEEPETVGLGLGVGVGFGFGLGVGRGLGLGVGARVRVRVRSVEEPETELRLSRPGVSA